MRRHRRFATAIAVFALSGTALQSTHPAYAEPVPLMVASVCLTASDDKAANLATIDAAMGEAAAAGAHLVAVPMNAIQANPSRGFVTQKPTPEEVDKARQEAERVPGPSTLWLGEKAREHAIYLVTGMIEIGDDDQLYNTSVLLGPFGELAACRAHKLWDASLGGNEHLFYATADTPGAVVATRLGQIGLMVGVDMYYEYGPSLAAAGADLLVTIASWAAAYSGCYEGACLGNASSGLWHVVANQVGVMGHASHYGHARVLDPEGTIVVDTGPEAGMVVTPTTIMVESDVLSVSNTATHKLGWGAIKAQ